MNREFDLKQRMTKYSVGVLKLCDQLKSSNTPYSIIDQLTRSAISSSLNYSEAIAAESNKDFIHKMSVCLKELRESSMCVTILDRYLGDDTRYGIAELTNELDQLIRIFYASIKTAKSKQPIDIKNSRNIR